MRVGGDGTRVTNWVDRLELLQQSTAIQIREIVAPHPTELVTIPIWVTVTPVPALLVQHDTTAGGVVSSGALHLAVVLVHTRTGGAGKRVTCWLQFVKLPQQSVITQNCEATNPQPLGLKLGTVP